MFCPQCGTGNAEGAAVCVKCGASLMPAQVVVPPGYSAQPRPDVPNYQVPAIVMTVLTTLCCNIFALPCAIIALVYSTQVNSKLAVNDVSGAMAASKNAKLFTWISVGVLVVTVGAYLILVFVGVMSGFAGHKF